MLQGGPINMGIKWRLLYGLCFHAGLFRKLNFAVSQFKHLTPKTTSLGVSKLWSTIFKIDGDIRICPDSSLLKINKIVQMLDISINFEDKKVDHILEISLDFQSLIDALYVIYQLSEIKDDI